MHYAAIAYLWSRWDVVIASTVSMGSLCGRSTRVFGAACARKALSWSHYAFRQRLISSAGRLLGCRRVVETGEAYTTKTCGLCGRRNDHVGGSKVFRCETPPPRKPGAIGDQAMTDETDTSDESDGYSDHDADAAASVRRPGDDGRRPCGVRIDRDVNGARNIALRVLTKQLAVEAAGDA